MKQTLHTLLSAAAERKLPCLLIGGNAVILLGYGRATVDIDLLVPKEKRPQWLDMMRDLGFQLYHGMETFAQFNPGTESKIKSPVDLMFVDASTWKNLDEDARQESIEGCPVRIPRPEHMIALKLHAASSPTREDRERDWEDIKRVIKACRLDPSDIYFRQIILRYGGEEALNRILRFLQ